MKTWFYDFVDRVGATLIIAILGIMLVGYIARKLLTGGAL